MRNTRYFRVKFVVAFLCLLIANIVFSSCESKRNSQQNAFLNRTIDEDEITDHELERNRELWQKSNVCSYRMVLEISEVSAMYSGLPRVEVQVQNGIVADVETIPKTDKGGILQERYEKYFTIEKLFDFIEFKIKDEQEYVFDANRGKVIGGLTVSYNSKLGYPEAIDFAPYQVALHGYLTIKVKSFKNLTVEYPCR